MFKKENAVCYVFKYKWFSKQMLCFGTSTLHYWVKLFKQRGVFIRLLEVFYLKEWTQKTKPDESKTIWSKCLISPGSAMSAYRGDNTGRLQLTKCVHTCAERPPWHSLSLTWSSYHLYFFSFSATLAQFCPFSFSTLGPLQSTSLICFL